MAAAWMKWMTELSSRKSVCRLMGKFSHSEISRLLIPLFAKSYAIPLHEAEKELREYRTLNEFFTRKLKPGMRPVHAEQGGMVSPVDALITFMGEIRSGTILNVKGQDYSVEELLNRSPRIESYKHGYAFVLYLSPTDYHRIHAPVTGKKLESEHIKGRVYPVNDFGMRHMKKVLCRNERLITYISHEHGEVALVKVGAMNVSSIKYTDERAKSWNQGDDLAYFEFGSTVVLLTQNGTFAPLPGLAPGRKIRMGEPLGSFAAAGAKVKTPPKDAD
ncbi:archaetidylserine decarboxylase [Paenibacillus macerans]|uniref:archaetidylserine decarboxylase n=1 Tax=Paenibacillus macerans TaxID=44252 RepID=UPI000ECFC8AF|nr:archaetidylserine decarboxylase [Paenibacillus macerans]MBS5912671.1 phosphatidylserine decarboxylase [Paenibacillus macerans]MDU5948920.1 archaetidylserine decarboxylase [Paenibacillus macerans]MEC0141589.1 archaetidylserine decarboxylase [Paenibacillus macerans]MEC0333691.1 archaetidylserine decarboxylase [Paenibacillus macerans]UMV47588.1 archaetidylserine decarboxylase [Paenibacillus macerans]